MSETLQWAQPADGAFEQPGAWTNGGSTTDTPTVATAVRFATGAAAAYVVSGGGTAASIASADSLTLNGTVSAVAAVSVTAGTLTVGGVLSDAEASIGPGSVVVQPVPLGVDGSTPTTSWTTAGTLHVGTGGAGTLTIGNEGSSNLRSSVVSDAVGLVDANSVVDVDGAPALTQASDGTWACTDSLQIGGSTPGTVVVSSDPMGLSVGGGGIAVGAGSVLDLDGAGTNNPAITLSGGALRLEGEYGYLGSIETATVSGPITLAAGTRNTLDGSGSKAPNLIGGTLSGTGPTHAVLGLISGAGTLLVDDMALLDPANAYTGGTVIEGGTLYLAAPGSAGGGPIGFAASATGTLAFGAASGRDTVSIGSARASVLAGGVGLLLALTTGQLTLDGGTASSTVQGGAGSVTVSGGTGGGQFFGGTGGDNQLTAGAGLATLIGGGSGDVLTAGPAGGDLLAAGSGAETLSGTSATGADAFFGGSGPDLIDTGTATDTVTAGAGLVTVQAGGVALVFGSTAALTFYGAAAAATVVGGAGVNALNGAAGTLAFYAGQGGGAAFGGAAGSNVLYTGAAATTLAGGGNNDLLVSTGRGGNLLLAGPGNQTLSGSASTGNDVYFGNSGNVLIAAGEGSDTVVAGSGAQTIDAGATGSTAIFAGSGQDTVVLGGGPDFVLCGQGNAMVYGGAGADLYGFANGTHGTEVVSGFRPGTDRLQLLGFAASTAATAVAGQIDAGGSTTLVLTDNTRVTLLGVASVGGASFV